MLSVQALGLTGSDDPTELAVAAEQGRILVTQDVQTVTRFAFERVDAGLPMPGVIEVVAGDWRARSSASRPSRGAGCHSAPNNLGTWVDCPAHVRPG